MAIDQHLDGVFIHVTDMGRAISWYSQLLGLNEQEKSHEDMIYNLPLDGPVQVILDAFPKESSPRGTGPRVMFTTNDIAAAKSHVQRLGSNASDVQDIGSSLVFYVEDPDRNLICIRQAK